MVGGRGWDDVDIVYPVRRERAFYAGKCGLHRVEPEGICSRAFNVFVGVGVQGGANVRPRAFNVNSLHDYSHDIGSIARGFPDALGGSTWGSDISSRKWEPLQWWLAVKALNNDYVSVAPLEGVATHSVT